MRYFADTANLCFALLLSFLATISNAGTWTPIFSDPTIITGTTVSRTYSGVSTLHYSSIRITYTVNLTAATSGYYAMFSHNGSWTVLCNDVRIRHGNNDNKQGVAATTQARLTDDFSALCGNKSSVTLKIVLDEWKESVSMGNIVVEGYKENPVANTQAAVVTSQDTPTSSIALSVSDPQNTSLTVSVDTGPSHGTLAWLGTSFVYTPNSCFFGTDSFQYHVEDFLGQASATRTISINVDRVNSPITLATIPNIEMMWHEAKDVTLSGISAGHCGTNLTVSATSSNTDIVLVPSIEYTSPSTQGVLKLRTVQPVIKQRSVNTITVQVQDGHNDTVTRTFDAAIMWNSLFR